MLTLLSALVVGGTMQVVGNIDPEQSHFEFTVPKRIGPPVRGYFKESRGVLRIRNDGERQVTIVLDAESIQVGTSAVQTRVAKSNAMFGASTFPTLTFQSDWHDPKVLHTGGAVTGTLTIRGITQRATMRVSPSTCSAPGFACEVQAKGQVNREQYGMGSLGGILKPDVELSMTVRFNPAGI